MIKVNTIEYHQTKSADQEADSSVSKRDKVWMSKKNKGNFKLFGENSKIEQGSVALTISQWVNLVRLSCECEKHEDYQIRSPNLGQ